MHFFYFFLQSVRVTIGGTCDFNLQCNGTEFATVCDHGSCSCSPGYIQISRKCYPGKICLVQDDKYHS